MDSLSDLYELITIIPTLTPVVQIIIIVSIGFFCIFSVASRIIPELGYMIWNKDIMDSRSHLIAFTIIPLVIFFIILTQIIISWKADASFMGNFRFFPLIVSILSWVLGLFLFGYAAYRKERANNLNIYIQIVLIFASTGFIILGTIANLLL